MLKKTLKVQSASGEKAAIASALSGSYSTTHLLNVSISWLIMTFTLIQMLFTMLCPPKASTFSVQHLMLLLS
jgi:hypothetical protein